MLIARTTGLLAVFAAALAAQALTKEGRLGNHFTFRYPESWEFSSGGQSGTLQMPPAEPEPENFRKNKTLTDPLNIRLQFVSGLTNDADPSQVLAVAAGGAAAAPGSLTRPERTTLGEQGGWIHTLRLASGERARIYALRLRDGGSALLTASGADSLLNTTRPTLEAVLRSLRSLDPAAKDAPPGDAPPAPAPPPVPLVPVRTLPPGEEARLIEHWNSTLSGHTWTAGRKLWKLSPDGRYEFESVITIAGLEEANSRRSTSSGQWRISVRDAEPWLELRPDTGEPMFIACAESGGGVRIDGEAATSR